MMTQRISAHSSLTHWFCSLNPFFPIGAQKSTFHLQARLLVLHCHCQCFLQVFFSHLIPMPQKSWCRFQACCFKVLCFLDSSVELLLVMRMSFLYFCSIIEPRFLFVHDLEASINTMTMKWLRFDLAGINKGLFSHIQASFVFFLSWFQFISLHDIIVNMVPQTHADQCML